MLTVADERLDAINAQLVAGTRGRESAKTQVQLLIENLYRADGVRIARLLQYR